MGRKRRSRRDLPERMYFNHGAYYFVTPEGKWNKLGRTLPEALAEYGKIIEPDNLNTMDQIMDRYLTEIVPTKAERTQLYQNLHIRRLKKCFGHMKPDSIKPKDIYRYRDERSRKNGKAVANLEKSTLSSIFSRAIEWGCTEKNPCKVVKNLPTVSRDRYVTDEEFLLLKSNANETIQCIMDMAYVTGLRKGDILKIQLSDIRDGDLHVITEKDKKKLAFNIVGDLAVIIDRAKAIRKVLSPYLFCNSKGQKITVSNFNFQWRYLKIKVGLHDKNLHFHDIRAKAGTDADYEGKNAQKMLGHKSRSMTEHYIKQRQFDRITPLDKIKKE